MNEREIKRLQGRTMSEMGSKWNIENLGKARLPKLFGEVANKKPFDNPVTATSKMSSVTPPAGVIVQKTANDESFLTAEGIHIEDMPIKFPGTEYRIPQLIWDNFGDLLIQQMDLEKQVNPDHDDQYVYLTIQQNTVQPSKVQRWPGTHIDGFQKAAIVPQIIQHQISVCNAVPTIFYAKGLDSAALKLPKKEFFREMAQQCVNAPSYEPPPYQIHLLNAYCPHEPGEAQQEEFRTFVRFSISSIPFMGEENTRNPLFKYEWNDEAKAAYYKSIAKPETPKP